MKPELRLKKCIQIPLKKGEKPTEPLIEGIVNPLSGNPPNAEGKLNMNLQNRDGYTALHFAARKGFAQSLLLLLDAGADYDIVSTGSEKVTAEELTNDKKCKDYLANAIVLKAQREKMKAIAVKGLECYTAVLKGDLRGVIRVSEGKSPAPSETYSYRPTNSDHYMIRNAIDLQHFDILKQILDQDADKDIWDSRKRTPLMHICSIPRAGSYPTTKFSRDKEKMRQEMLDQILNNGMYMYTGTCAYVCVYIYVYVYASSVIFVGITTLDFVSLFLPYQCFNANIPFPFIS
jgi:hypothetical protein